jgi:hypothetical protein
VEILLLGSVATSAAGVDCRFCEQGSLPCSKKPALRIGINRTPSRANPREKWPFALIWSRADVIGLFSNNVVSFSRNVVLSGPSFSNNVVWKRAMLSVRADYVLSSLQLSVSGALLSGSAALGSVLTRILAFAL